ncbi:Alpha/Beta hydrolase protein [Microdochium trichocladiopsis]|uniref:Alpha/Beta hydrolase protein n=1 Tax=Microdochium trichocladiopsis TaxID=1682393 RepID=A0A9P9BQ23_9PEZI|nr:Alpha/Beta hydrolase protein [Microdochium trichocladiopsis]KAH7029832.1 Alpha/Beta hydrolase protein [Microdochium trichocladiopsis]
MEYPPTVQQVTAHPAFTTAIWGLRPTQSGLLPVGEVRTTPAKVSWEVHGHGPLKIIFICGLGLAKADFQNQTLFFGHNNGDKYSLLLVDNRGLGGSAAGCPLHRTSTSHMALDILEVADHLGWTDPRQLHICGGSMGGMIAQELAFAAPSRVCTLSLWSTTARYENTSESWWQGVKDMLGMVWPKTLEDEVRHIAKIAYPPEWLAAEDDVDLPGPMTPGLNGQTPLRFVNNYERFVAVEVAKRKTPGSFTFSGFAMHAAAAATHSKTPEQLRSLADEVGRERIMIVHGSEDKAMPVLLGRKLIDHVQPAQAFIVDGLAHAPIHERPTWFNELLAGIFDMGEKMTTHIA